MFLNAFSKKMCVKGTSNDMHNMLSSITLTADYRLPHVSKIMQSSNTRGTK